MKEYKEEKESPIGFILFLALLVTGSIGIGYWGFGFGDSCNSGYWFLHGEKHEGEIISIEWQEKKGRYPSGWVYEIAFEDAELLSFIQGGYINSIIDSVYYVDDCEVNWEEPLKIGQKVVFNGAKLSANEFFTYNRYNVMKMEVED